MGAFDLFVGAHHYPRDVRSTGLRARGACNPPWSNSVHHNKGYLQKQPICHY